MYASHGIAYYRQVPKTQKVYFEKSQAFKYSHGILRDELSVVCHKRHIVRHRPRGYDNSGGMGRAVAGHSLHLHRHVKKVFYLIGIIAHLLKFLI